MATDTVTTAHSTYRACIKEAGAQGRDLMLAALRRARESVASRTERARDAADRQRLHEAAALLDRHEVALAAAYPQALLIEFAGAIADAGARGQGAALSFAELELVDDDQVQESVEVVRTQQAVESAVEAELVHLNALVCAAQGLRIVQGERNPLRPESYVRALRKVVAQSAVPAPVRLAWLQLLGDALGPELAQSYGRLVAFLRGHGISEAGFQIVSTAPERPAGAPAAAREVSTLLTVRGLQRLLAGEFDPKGAEQADREAPTQPPGFAETVPAAMGALKDIRQVEAVVQRLREREIADGGSIAVREALKSQVHRPGQAIALEVVSLMVENIVGDQRLLPAVRGAIRALEPALLRLALADPRFFSDRRHPARRFLDEVTTRSLAWSSGEEAGFDKFIGPLREAVDALVATQVVGAEPYDFALQTLDDAWTRHQSRERRQREKAVRVLVRAEQRNLLAARLADEIAARADLQLAPDEVVGFLLGPWVQVLAHAQLDDQGGEADPGGYRAVVPELLWSVLPHTTPAAAARLARRLPALLETLQAGLMMAGHAHVQVRRFLDRLGDLHQRALKGQGAAPSAGDVRTRGRVAVEQLLGPMLDPDAWIAPAEAHDSGFMDPSTRMPLFQATQAGFAPTSAGAAGGPELPLALAVGHWIELQQDGQLLRWQFTWASPHGTLMLFTDAAGKTHSMTPRLAQAMAEAGTMRPVASGAVVDGALDAVADAALRNSLDPFRP